MKKSYKYIAGLLVFSVIGLFSSDVAFGDGPRLFAKAEKKPITRYEPKFMSEPEQDIPLEKKRQVKQKKPNWLMYGLGGALVVGLAVAVGLGGGGDERSVEKDEGTITVEW